MSRCSTRHAVVRVEVDGNGVCDERVELRCHRRRQRSSRAAGTPCSAATGPRNWGPAGASKSLELAKESLDAESRQVLILGVRRSAQRADKRTADQCRHERLAVQPSALAADALRTIATSPCDARTTAQGTAQRRTAPGRSINCCSRAGSNRPISPRQHATRSRSTTSLALRNQRCCCTPVSVCCQPHIPSGNLQQERNKILNRRVKHAVSAQQNQKLSGAVRMTKQFVQLAYCHGLHCNAVVSQ